MVWKNKRVSTIPLLLCATVFVSSLDAQTPPPPQDNSNGTVPIYSVTVVQRALRAVNFQRHAGATRLNMKGTILLPKADGEAKVEVKNGYTEVDVNFRKLDPPTRHLACLLPQNRTSRFLTPAMLWPWRVK